MSCNSSGSSSICSVDEHIHEILRRKEGRKEDPVIDLIISDLIFLTQAVYSNSILLFFLCIPEPGIS